MRSKTECRQHAKELNKLGADAVACLLGFVAAATGVVYLLVSGTSMRAEVLVIDIATVGIALVAGIGVVRIPVRATALAEAVHACSECTKPHRSSST